MDYVWCVTTWLYIMSYLCILTCSTFSGIEIAKMVLWNKVCMNMNMNMEEP
jgi:hypothetical protein